ncbi:unnamed protein product [Dovyalis caffra]|uniref:Uncharacterized protein n=1 Tax=Dovyalis caffra TaxID=77055 RepID=A0AAV1RF67_9ROSI|nr:unnamed protein product [Dovyalis caffra]
MAQCFPKHGLNGEPTKTKMKHQPSPRGSFTGSFVWSYADGHISKNPNPESGKHTV